MLFFHFFGGTMQTQMLTTFLIFRYCECVNSVPYWAVSILPRPHIYFCYAKGAQSFSFRRTLRFCFSKHWFIINTPCCKKTVRGIIVQKSFLICKPTNRLSKWRSPKGPQTINTVFGTQIY